MRVLPWLVVRSPWYVSPMQAKMSFPSIPRSVVTLLADDLRVQRCSMLCLSEDSDGPLPLGSWFLAVRFLPSP